MSSDRNLLSVLVRSATRIMPLRLLTVSTLAIAMLAAAAAPASAGWFKRITNLHGAQRFVNRATNTNGIQRVAKRVSNPHGIEHFWNTNKAGLERWARRLCPAQDEKQTETGYQPRSYRCEVKVNFGGSSGQH